jgi:hypothetical protein
MKKEIKYAMLLIGAACLAFVSCKKEQRQSPVYMGYDYFPNNVGHYVIYRCDSIIANPQISNIIPPFDTFHYQVKEVIDSLYLNNQGQLTQRIVRYKRTDSTIPWSNILTIQKVWTGTLLTTMATRLEDNNNYIKLIFPLKLGEQWNGNAMNTLAFPGSYQYTALNTPAIVNGVLFDSTLTVMQVNQSSFLGNQYYYEQYATGVGLIYREVIDWQTDGNLYPTSTSPPKIDSAKAGTVIYTESYLSSGN